MMIGDHLIKSWSSTQPSQTLSSGEAEMVGVTKAAAAALGFRSLLADFGVYWPARIYTDSSASIGMCTRQGIGKVRHMDTQVMWIQQRIRNNDLDLYKILGEKNPADLMTKAEIPKDRMEKLLEKMGCSFESGRAATAPKLRTEGGKKLFTVETQSAQSSAHFLRGGQLSASQSSSANLPLGGLTPAEKLKGQRDIKDHENIVDVQNSIGEQNTEEASSSQAQEFSELSSGGAKPAGWNWSDELDEELARGESHPLETPVRVPAAPPEAAESEDPLTVHGELLGAEGRGRSTLDLRKSSECLSRGVVVCEGRQRGRESSYPVGTTSAVRGPPTEALVRPCPGSFRKRK